MIPVLLTVSAIATSSTGGNVAGPGGVVRTGDSYSSAHVRTVVGAGTTSVQIEVSSNGRTERVDRTFREGERASVSATVTSTTGTPARSLVPAPASIVIPRIPNAAVEVHSSTTLQASSSASTSATPEPGWGMRLIEMIRSFLQSIFGFL